MLITIHNHSNIFEHVQHANNGWKSMGVRTTKSKHNGVLVVCCMGACPLVVWCVGELVVCFLRVPTIVWFGGVGELVCWCP